MTGTVHGLVIAGSRVAGLSAAYKRMDADRPELVSAPAIEVVGADWLVCRK